MKARLLTALVGALVLVTATSASAQTRNGGSPAKSWTPKHLADGQPDIQGMWNNEEANFTPMELPKELAGRTSFTREELQKLAEDLGKRRVDAGDSTGPGDVGFYGLYWFDWYWRKPLAGDWPALVVEPKDGKMPAVTPEARKTAAFMRDHLHDGPETMEAGDRCVSRGVLGMMLPTAYNNGKFIVQVPGYVLIQSEMIHNARIIPIDGRPHLDANVRQWEGDPRGHWDGNTLVVESTNFRAVDNLRAPIGRARQTEKRRMVERFTIVDANTLKYSVSVEDPDTYTAPFTISFPYTRDDNYQQFEYACHEANYSVPNSLKGARTEEQDAAAKR